MSVLIGSHALNMHIPGFRKKPADVDYVMTEDEFIDYVLANDGQDRSMTPLDGAKKFAVVFDDRIVEIDVAQPGSSSAMLLDIVAAEGGQYVGDHGVPS